MKRVLIIEDDPIVGSIYRSKLGADGYEVALASDGASGLDQLAGFRPDIVLLDLMLPRLNGVEVLREIRARPESRAIPVIVFSNTYLSQMVQDAWKAGATKCLAKINSTPKQVVEVLRAVLDSAAASNPAPALPATAPPAQVGGESDQDVQLDNQVRREFLASSTSGVAVAQRALVELLAIDRTPAQRSVACLDLYRSIHALAGQAALARAHGIAQLASALEVLVRSVHEKGLAAPPHSLRTVQQGIECLQAALPAAFVPEIEQLRPALALIIGDDLVSRRRLAFALERARIETVTTGDHSTAKGLAEENIFDFIVLDLKTPVSSMMLLVNQLMRSPGNKNAGLMLVLEASDAAPSLPGQSAELLLRPLLPVEVAVKCLVLLTRQALDASSS